MTARDAALEQYERAYERLTVDEQLARPLDPDLAEDYHRLAVVVLKGRIAEDDNPKAKPPCGCLECSAIYAAGGSR